MKSGSSSETFSSAAIEYCVLTEGWARPVSTWEIKLGEKLAFDLGDDQQPRVDLPGD